MPTSELQSSPSGDKSGHRKRAAARGSNKRHVVLSGMERVDSIRARKFTSIVYKRSLICQRLRTLPGVNVCLMDYVV